MPCSFTRCIGTTISAVAANDVRLEAIANINDLVFMFALLLVEMEMLTFEMSKRLSAQHVVYPLD